MLQVDDLYSRGNDANARSDFATAAELYRKGLAIKPDWPEAKHNLASVLYQLGCVDEALELFREAQAGLEGAFSRGMMAVIAPGAPGATNEIILQVRQDWARVITPDDVPVPAAAAHKEAIKLRIGYFCSFFDRPNYMKPVWGLINRHHRRRFEIHLFSDIPREGIHSGYRPDASDQFHYTGNLGITDCAAAIRSAQLDLLIDLNAYSRWRRMPIYGLKPAPIIATWFNSYATTGMSSVDYIIGDAEVVPPEEDRYCSEKVLRVPGSYLTFEVSYAVPDVAPPPCLAANWITFGCLAPLYKITPQVIAAWSKILNAAPPATLFLRNAAFAVSENREYLLRTFEKHGISRDRVQLEGPAEHFQFLSAYEKIDIALDTFPYNGGTTTMEALWQGVPVLTFYGDRWASRTSASILRAGNLGYFVAADLQRYIESAIALANDRTTPSMLTGLRRNMRKQLICSPVCDLSNFVLQMENLYCRLVA